MAFPVEETMIHEETISHLYAQREGYSYRAMQASSTEIAELYRRYVAFYDGILEDALALWHRSGHPPVTRSEVPKLHWDQSRLGRSEPLNALRDSGSSMRSSSAR